MGHNGSAGWSLENKFGQWCLVAVGESCIKLHLIRVRVRESTLDWICCFWFGFEVLFSDSHLVRIQIWVGLGRSGLDKFGLGLQFRVR